MLVVLCNTPPDHASVIARTLVEEGRAACVNILPGVTSFYVWEGSLCEDAECTLLIKVTRAGFAALEARLVELHPYTVPEIIGLPPETVHGPYAEWVRASVTPESDPEPPG